MNHNQLARNLRWAGRLLSFLLFDYFAAIGFFSVFNPVDVPKAFAGKTEVIAFLVLAGFLASFWEEWLALPFMLFAIGGVAFLAVRNSAPVAFPLVLSALLLIAGLLLLGAWLLPPTRRRL